jgi:hypothetical protein
VAAHVLFIHDRPDWLLLAILAECRHLDVEATERFCFERWFLIHAYVELSGREPVYLDSDCLPLPGFAIDKLPQGPMLDTPFLNPIRSRESLRGFLDFMTEVHENGEIASLAERHEIDGTPHVSDMFLLKEYAVRFPDRCRGVSPELPSMGLCPNLHFHRGFTQAHGVRQVFRDVLDGTFHCRRTDGTLQRFYSLHFQGDSKRLAPLFLRRSTVNASFGRATLKSLYRDRYGCNPASARASPLH